MATNKQLEVQAREIRAQVNRLDETVDGLDEKLNQILNAVGGQGKMPSVPEKAPPIPAVPAGTPANQQGVTPSTIIEPMEMDLGADIIVDEVTLIQRPANVQDVDDPHSKAKLDTLAFYNEPVVIYIQEVHEKDAAISFEVSVNGDRRIFVRGNNYTVPRYIVEQLARAKPIHYDNIEYTKDNGERSVRWPGRHGLRYPFSIISDPNPLGVEWITRVLKEKN